LEQVEPVVILAGGKGMRLREYTDTLPKALVPIGPYPVILHVMKIYAAYGFRKFILSLGYRGDLIKEYFMNHEWMAHDFTLKMGRSKEKDVLDHEDNHLDYEITFAETGLDTPTGGRIKKIAKYVESENFHVTYCDGLADIDINELTNYHRRMGKIGTVTAVHVMSPFGIIEVDNLGIARSFKEKPTLPGYINGGFLMFRKEFFDYVTEESVLEEDPLRTLAAKNQLAAYRLEKFWACMDTFKDVERLNTFWEKGNMPHTGYKGKPPWVHENK
jgi:glucose-1-phosphate cytidylyltransferase